MIKTFRDAATEELFLSGKSRKLPADIYKAGSRRLGQVHAAKALNDLRGAGAALERLKSGAYSIRVNDRYRLTFRWEGGDAYDVEILDYH